MAFDYDPHGKSTVPIYLVDRTSLDAWLTGRRGSTIAAETKARLQLIQIFKEDPNRLLSKERCRGMLNVKLGVRAFGRVWSRATEEFPERREPGRRKSKRHAN
jgi:hypothetical protein